jgi:hypothetical protein
VLQILIKHSAYRCNFLMKIESAVDMAKYMIIRNTRIMTNSVIHRNYPS